MLLLSLPHRGKEVPLTEPLGGLLCCHATMPIAGPEFAALLPVSDELPPD